MYITIEVIYVIFKVFINLIVTTTCDLNLHDCHDEATLRPVQGIVEQNVYTWLGILQYIEVKTGNPHYFREPRVVLVSRDFALCSAEDAAQIPDGYALGNVVFGEYDRDERECGISQFELVNGMVCEPAVLIIPISDVLLHPEYKHFNQPHSIALLKLLTSVTSSVRCDFYRTDRVGAGRSAYYTALKEHQTSTQELKGYMLPVCLPFINYLNFFEPSLEANETVYHIDFADDVPRDFPDESKKMSRLVMHQDIDCFVDEKSMTTEFPMSREDKRKLLIIKKLMTKANQRTSRTVCSMGCGFRSGAPSVVHEKLGHWTLVAISVYSKTCADPFNLRVGRQRPSTHLMIHPYVPWITNAIYGKPATTGTHDDPFNYVVPRMQLTEGRDRWIGRQWCAGFYCFINDNRTYLMHIFYHEVFHVEPDRYAPNLLTYVMQLEAPPETVIVCAKMSVPFKLPHRPTCEGMWTNMLKIKIPIMRLYYRFDFELIMYGINKTNFTGWLFPTTLEPPVIKKVQWWEILLQILMFWNWGKLLSKKKE